jgi:hypothetical protein
LDVKQVSGYALYKFFFERFCQAFHAQNVFCFELVHVLAYLGYVENGIGRYALVCLFMLGVGMNVYMGVYAL